MLLLVNFSELKNASKFNIEIKRVVNKYTTAISPTRSVPSIIDNFDNGKDDLILPQWLFEERKA